MKLLIVESPGKIKTLRKILGPGWALEASVGHTTELASDGEKKLGFEIKHGRVTTRYVARGSRGRQVLAKLRVAVKKADEIFLAMDPDREGEAIAWHLVEQLKLKKFFRVTYTQITDQAVKAALRSPRQLNLPLIEAQRARQCLDKLVGYEVSPLLWRTTGGKSAGRVQSAALHLLCERERERLKFKPEDYWTLQTHYEAGLVGNYEATPATRVASVQEAEKIKKIALTNPHIIESIKDTEERRLPLPPLITSTLQQTASVRLKLSPRETMEIAQQLYEGIDGQGLITYMRTDAVVLSPEFIADARRWLGENAPEALADKAPVFKKVTSSQGAHEAIRPTIIEFTPIEAKSRLTPKQLSVYKLIWDRAIASQCRPARLAKLQINIKAAETLWVARGLRVIEPGYLQFWRNIEQERDLTSLKSFLKIQNTLKVKKITVEKKTTQPPPRYSEAKLVQLMEKVGIGRPSTYASTVLTLRERGYASLESGALQPTGLGLATDELLTKALPELVDIRFTAQMEASLDQIAENKIGWQLFLSEWDEKNFRLAMANARNVISTLTKTLAKTYPANTRADVKVQRRHRAPRRGRASK